MLDEQVLESIPLPSVGKSSSYVAGVIRDGQVHLVPLKSIVQMKTKFQHLDDADTMKRRAKGKIYSEEK